MTGVKSTSRSKLVAALGSPRTRVTLAAIASAITWFCWAWWVNRADPEQALMSGLYQGAVNLFTTAVGSSALEALFVLMGTTLAGRAGCVLIVSSGSLSLMLLAHWHAQTPNILLTVLPVYGVVLLFCSSYIMGLGKLKNQYDHQEVVT